MKRCEFELDHFVAMLMSFHSGVFNDNELSLGRRRGESIRNDASDVVTE